MHLRWRISPGRSDCRRQEWFPVGQRGFQQSDAASQMLNVKEPDSVVTLRHRCLNVKKNKTYICVCQSINTSTNGTASFIKSLTRLLQNNDVLRGPVIDVLLLIWKGCAVSLCSLFIFILWHALALFVSDAVQQCFILKEISRHKELRALCFL